jgi:hypothetical protein
LPASALPKADGDWQLLRGNVVAPDGSRKRLTQLENQTETPRIVHRNALAQNYPNPFNPTTTIEYSIAQASEVTLVVFNAAGQHVRTLVSERQKANGYSVTWNGINDSGQQVSSGIYFYRLQAGSYTSTRKMVLLK